jgi:hypothetical protein
MKNLLFSLFAIGVAAVAAMTATTAMLNAPQRAQPAVVSTLSPEESQGTAPASSLAQDSKPTPESGSAPAKPGESPGASGAAADTKPAADGEEEADKDPYEGVPEEELPPDMQYSADSSVSFPTNI